MRWPRLSGTAIWQPELTKTAYFFYRQNLDMIGEVTNRLFNHLVALIHIGAGSFWELPGIQPMERTPVP
ncbi:MAG: hypothetical protein MZV64_09145 [Ignavibacteriales bacterium]|nr:hypothetical protein [Ignavibacteriales bacterium]